MVQLAEVAMLQTKVGLAIEQYLDEMHKKSKNTARNYKSDIDRFFKEQFKKTINIISTKELDSIDYDMLIAYRSEMYGNVTNTTINRHMSSIRTILRHLKTRNMLASDISYLDLIKSLPDDTVEIEHMPKEVVLEYINEADKEMNHSKLKQQLMILAVDTGFRLEELLSLEKSQFIPQG